MFSSLNLCSQSTCGKEWSPDYKKGKDSLGNGNWPLMEDRSLIANSEQKMREAVAEMR